MKLTNRYIAVLEKQTQQSGAMFIAGGFPFPGRLERNARIALEPKIQTHQPAATMNISRLTALTQLILIKSGRII
jgi:hypothetical protein